jgi:hypothetical protein
VVLDNARDADQVIDLLPGSAGCLAIVTSRPRLSRLRTGTGAHLISLDLPGREEARSYLVSHVGAERDAAECDALDAIVDHCDRLPMAMAIVGVRAASYPELPLHDILKELQQTASKLDAFEHHDVGGGVRAVFATSYRLLTAPAARLFRLLSLHLGTDITVPTAASLAGVPLHDAYLLMEELQQSGLLREHRPGRYWWHELVRAYMTELCGRFEPGIERQRAMERCYHTTGVPPTTPACSTSPI